MIYTGTNPEDRILYTYEERKALLTRNYGICARCGKKLNTKTMTVEHIIPLSRGGKNEDANKTVLCQECNKEKGNLFYLPSGFYHALVDTPRYQEMGNYVRDWYHGLSPEDRLDLRWFPLITPRNAIFIQTDSFGGYLGHRKKTPGINPQSVLEWNIVGNDNREEVEAVTGWYVRQVRSLTEHEPHWMETESAVYILKKRSTDKLLCLAGLYYQPEEYSFRVCPVWSTLGKTILPQVVLSLAHMAIYSLETIAQERIVAYEIQSALPHALDAFSQGSYLPPGMGKRGHTVHYKDGFSDPCIRVDREDIEEFIRSLKPGHSKKESEEK